MRSATSRTPVRRPEETASLPGLFEFRPRLGVVLVFLTLTVAVVGWRIAGDSGARRVDRLAREAIGRFESPASRGAAQAPLPEADAGKKLREHTGIPFDLPSGDPEFIVIEVRRETFDRHAAASMRFLYEGDPFLLVVSPGERLLGSGFPSAFPEGSFLSGEREGHSYVFWERKGAFCMLVSGVDVARTFDLVRRLFT
ncbi:MAG: hypothetical protein OHK0028_08560 [Deltaproteobacteria bacterium]